MKVLLVENDITNTFLENILKSDGYDLLKISYNDRFLRAFKGSNANFIVLNLDTPCEKLIRDLHIINQQSSLPVILFANDHSSQTIDKIIEAEVSIYVVDGLSTQRLSTIMTIAQARYNQMHKLKESLETARVQLEDRKQVDRAKAILIKTRNFTEHEAYHTLRKLAMDRHITLGEMSRNVIAMAELLK
jgi:two-component system, response regulator / RNA-binding antiterminator